MKDKAFVWARFGIYIYIPPRVLNASLLHPVIPQASHIVHKEVYSQQLRIMDHFHDPAILALDFCAYHAFSVPSTLKHPTGPIA